MLAEMRNDFFFREFKGVDKLRVNSFLRIFSMML